MERELTLPAPSLAGVLSSLCVLFYGFIGLYFSIQVDDSLENTGTYNSTSEATTKHIMLSLFSVRIPVPVLFFNGQSEQCDTATGDC